ncbi:MAG: polysaccharide deacetylase family protein [Thermoanaerobaculales bacterium]
MIAVVAGASALLMAEVGLKVAELIAVNSSVVRSGTFSEIDPSTNLTGRFEVDDDQWRLEISGQPGVAVLVLADDRPLRVVTLDDDGFGAVGDLGIGFDGAPLRLVPLAAFTVDLEAPTEPAVTATATAKPSPTRTLTPTPTVTATPSAAPSPTNTLTATLTATASPSATPAPSRTHRATATFRLTPSPRPPVPAEAEAAASTPKSVPPILQLVPDAGRRIAITFDGNASSNGTADLLDLLERLDLKITLFVTGQFIEEHPTLVRRALLAGHEIGNHTFDHPHLTTYEQDRRQRLLPTVTRDWFSDQLRQTEDAFLRATGHHLQPLWRAPFGEENRILRGWGLEMGYLHVRWSSLEGASLDSRDWVADEHSSLYQSSSRIMERLLGFPKLEGGIILMHLATHRSEPPWRELPTFVETLRGRGMETVAITKLLEKSPRWRPWLRRAKKRHRIIYGE